MIHSAILKLSACYIALSVVFRYSQEEIDKKVAAYREKLMENQTNLKIETDETSGRPT